MCDYSLMAIPNRLAEEGEDLVTHRFSTGSLGLASPLDLRRVTNPVRAQTRREFRSSFKDFMNPPELKPVPAVCVPPGARLILQDIPGYLQRDLEIGPVEEVVFTQLTAAVNTQRDAIRFKDGREIRLRELDEGQRVKVLSLSSAQAFEPVPEEQAELLFRRR